ncbi:ferritin [Desulfocarbo indianensis]|nr:ferritin [Desulfocarbo indianensis]
MVSQKMTDAINEQINAELYSAYLYMSMAAYFEDLQLPGMAHWMVVQSQEEMSHALRFYKHLNERGGRAILKAIEGPETQWAAPLACFQAVAEHEAKVTSLINGLMRLARQEDDYASESFLQWFVNEQVEEEASAAEVVGKLKLVAETQGGLFMLDKELAARVFNMPPDLTI